MIKKRCALRDSITKRYSTSSRESQTKNCTFNSITANIMVSSPFILQMLTLLMVAVTAHSEKRAAILARRMVNLQSSLHFNSLRSDDIPISMAEYYVASDTCSDVEGLSNNGDPILLLSKMSTSYKNWHNNGTISVTIEKPKMGHFDGIMGKPRGIFFGKLRELHLSHENAKRLAGHFLIRHPDARHWLPDDHESHVHDTRWFEFEVQSVYFVGGFGDRSFIGNISGNVYHQDLRDDESYPCHEVNLQDALPKEVEGGSRSLSQQSSFDGFFQLIKTLIMNY